MPTYYLVECPFGYVTTLQNGNDFQLFKMKQFASGPEALEATSALMKSELPDSLSKFLKKSGLTKNDKLAVTDPKLANLITKKCHIPCIFNEEVDVHFRKIREQITKILGTMSQETLQQMSLGLAHTLNRHTLKFNAEKIDVMVIQAVGLLEDLDKEINTYAMRIKEWYGWHFPEMSKIVVDNMQYARCILKMGLREKCVKTDFSDVLAENVSDNLKEASKHSMGVPLTKDDIKHIKMLCEETLATSEYRGQLFDYLKARMQAIAPNLTAMVGEVLGAKLIGHAGSLVQLAKAPASTVQLYGAEKALFRSLKKKQNTPKYGLLFHASLVNGANARVKGKAARALGCKTALCTRVDAMSETKLDGASIAVDTKAKVQTAITAWSALAERKPPKPAAEKPGGRGFGRGRFGGRGDGRGRDGGGRFGGGGRRPGGFGDRGRSGGPPAKRGRF